MKSMFRTHPEPPNESHRHTRQTKSASVTELGAVVTMLLVISAPELLLEFIRALSSGQLLGPDLCPVFSPSHQNRPASDQSDCLP